ncbi:MAG: hypothetical protein RJB11_2046, partial [Planctomycetota bacterium]
MVLIFRSIRNIPEVVTSSYVGKVHAVFGVDPIQPYDLCAPLCTACFI